MHRFYTPALGRPGDLITLASDEAVHLTRVLRLRPGDRIALFDGRGGACEGTIATVRPTVQVRAGDRVSSAPEPNVRLTLAAAVLKGDGSDQVVRDAVMLGATAIQPVTSARTEVSRAALEGGRRRQRWQRIALASAKQCGRALLPEIAAPLDLPTLLRARHEGLRLMLVEPEADRSDRQTLAVVRDRPVPPAVTLVVGPEGGWTSDEIREAHEAGWTLLTLGGRTLRADAAAQVAIAALWAVWGEI